MQFRQHKRDTSQPLRLAALACGLLGGAVGILVAPFASGLLNDNAPLALPQLFLLMALGVMGIVGVVRRSRSGSGGIWSAFLFTAVAVFLTAGLHLLYRGDGLREPQAGLGLLLAGELLLCSFAISWLGPLPIHLRSTVVVSGLLLVSFVAPFSALPNPLGAYYLVAGGYRYEPHSPFVNRFATLRDGNPSALVSARLDLLIGETGLAPLDPRQPLESYKVRDVLSGGLAAWAIVRVELRFTDGQTRLISIPALDSPAGRLTALDRVTAPHRPVPGLLPASSEAPIQLGVPQALPLATAADVLLQTMLSQPQANDMRWSPDGRTVLMLVQPEQPGTGDRTPGLWVVPLDGGDPRKLVEEVTDATWSPDGRSVVALTWQPRDGSVWRRAIISIDVATGVSHLLGATDRSQIAVVRDQVFFLNGGLLWQAPVAGGEATRLAALPDAGPMVADGALAVSPDGQRVAYRCASDLCLADMQGVLLARQTLGFQPPPEPTGTTSVAGQINLAAPWSFSLTWSPDGRLLALATAAADQRGAPTLRLLTPNGQFAAVIGLGPDGPVDPPQWFPDDRRLLLTTYPLHGRRIIVVDVERMSVRDLTQPRWDAVGRLSPDGQRVLLWNGRGGLWAAPVETRPE